MKKKYYGLVLVVVVILALMVFVWNAIEPSRVPQDSQKTNEQVEQPNVQDDLYSWQKDTSPFSFDMFFYGAWGTFYKWRGALVEQFITEDTGATPNIIIPTGNEKEYLTVLIASGDLPDVMVLEWYAPETKRLIEAGLIHPINTLAESYAPGLLEMISDDIKTYHSHTDGLLYYLPSFFTTKEEYEVALERHGARSLFIQQGIYEALGRPSVETPEKLLQLLRDIRDQFPDVKPFAIEPPLDVHQWGLTGNLTMNYFAGIFAPETFGRELYLEDGQIRMIFENPNFIEAVKFLNQLVREDIISVDTLMMKHEIYGESVDSAQWGVAARFPIDIWKNHNPRIMSLFNDESKTYIPLGFQYHDGKMPQFAGGRGAGWVATMVTKNAENPDRIIRYLHYSWSDQGQLTNLFGREGETFSFVDGVPQYKPEILEEIAANPSALTDKFGFEQRLLMWRSRWAGLQRVAMAPQAYADYLRDVGKYGVDIWELGLDNLDPDPASSEGVAYARIKDVWNRYLARMVLSVTDEEFDSNYDQAMSEIREAGLEEVRAVMTQNHLADKARKMGE